MKTALNLCLLTSCIAAHAATLGLKAEPNAAAKIQAQAPSEHLITIFHPEKSEWVKVANTRNGDTGWVIWSQLHPEAAAEASKITTLDLKKAEALMERMAAFEARMRKSMQRTMRVAIGAFDAEFEREWNKSWADSDFWKQWDKDQDKKKPGWWQKVQNKLKLKGSV